jgi:hypothetical protein
MLIVGALFVVACGGSGSPKPAAQTANSQTDTASSSRSTSSDNSSDSSATSSDDNSGGPAVPGNYQQGSAHIEVSGGTNVNADFDTTAGSTTAGFTNISFTGQGGQLVITMSEQDNQSGLAVTFEDGLLTGGQFGDTCQLHTSKKDASEVAGTFTCTNVDGVRGVDAFTGNLNLEGTFSAKA